MKNGLKRGGFCCLVAFGILWLACGCNNRTDADQTIKLSLGTFTSGSNMDQAGMALGSAISNTVPGVYVETLTTKGAYMNINGLMDGTYDLIMVPAGLAYDAYTGSGVWEEEAVTDLRAIAAAYPKVSTWTAKSELGLRSVSELKGKVLSAGTEGSETAKVSWEAFDVLGITTENTEIWYYGIKDGSDGLLDGWADGIHTYAESPVEPYGGLLAEGEANCLTYSEEEIGEILKDHPEYSRVTVSAGTYENQTQDLVTFGEKVLLCTRKDLDSDLVHEIAWALEVNGPQYTAGLPFMRFMDDHAFRSQDIPIPLHEGAAAYEADRKTD